MQVNMMLRVTTTVHFGGKITLSGAGLGHTHVDTLDSDTVSDKYDMLYWWEESTHVSVKPFEFHFQEALQVDLILGKILKKLFAWADGRCIDDLV